MKFLFTMLVAAVTLCLGGAFLGTTQTFTSPQPIQATNSLLLDVLSYVPETFATNDSPSPIDYVDFRANDAAIGYNILERYLATDDLWVPSLRRVNFPGANFLLIQLQEMPELVGFSFTDVDWILSFGDPPNTIMVYGGDIDTDSMGDVLAGRDFELEEQNGIPVWHRFEDNQINLQAREPGDPFGGDLGAAARIAVFEGALANARSWGSIETVIDAKTTGTSLADMDEYRTLAEAVESGNGDLIHAWIFSQNAALSLVFLPDDPVTTLRNLPEEWGITTDTWGILPTPTLAALTDHQQGEDTVHVITLLYSSEDDAQAAAEEMTTRLQTFDPGIYEELGVTVDEPRIYTNDTGWAVAVAAVRYPLVVDPDADLGETPPPGALLNRWMQMFYRRELILLTSQLNQP